MKITIDKDRPAEFTILAIIVGIIIGIIMTAANVYLGLYAGMTVSASIPAAVIAMGIFKGVLRKTCIHQSNIVQTMASAGESLAAGIIFTLPALVLVGAWKDFDFWSTTLIAISGGLLGVIFMIPLRKALIVEDKDLTYPEGVACAAVLETGASEDSKGFKAILMGLSLGGIFKLLTSGFKVLHGEVATAFVGGKKLWFFGSDISPALLAIGYIVKLEVAVLVFLGGSVGWFFTLPFLDVPEGTTAANAVGASLGLWSTKIRYMGVGAMLVGGIWSIISVRKGIAKGLVEIKTSYQNRNSGENVIRTEENISLMGMLVVFIASVAIMFSLYSVLIDDLGFSIITTIIMLIASFLFVAVSSYIVGLVGSSNNPVSGMTICTLLGTSALFLVLGYHGDSAILATLGVASIVCCAACTAGDCSQDLKTGVIIGATPKHQQYAQFIGVIIPAFIIAPVLSLLHNAYGIGSKELLAPQASLFASITQAFFGDGELQTTMVAIGAILAVFLIIADKFLASKSSKFRLHVMPVAVGIYLPITLAAPIFLGGIIRHFVDKARTTKMDEHTDSGILLSSGLIAGEAIIGVILAIIIYFEFSLSNNPLSQFFITNSSLSTSLSIICFLGLAFYLFKKAKDQSSSAS